MPAAAVTAGALPSARMAATEPKQAFVRLAEPFRPELRLHCYRMLGSVHEAEDLVQETYLRAWRSFEQFDDGSFRAWLYRIATNACLNALESKKSAQRLLPDQVSAATVKMPGAPAADVAWLEPYPDVDLEGVADAAPGPEARYAARESVQLAFVAALQQLPARQRAALMLCDVLGWPAAEAASLLESSTAAVNSALQRARETLAKTWPEGRTVPPIDAAQQQLLVRYLKAWESHDADGFGALLKEDASVVMPPWLEWYVGRETIRAFFAKQWQTCAGLRLRPTGANGQPAFGVYERAADGRFAAHSLHVITFAGAEISTVTLFHEPKLFRAFGLPASV